MRTNLATRPYTNRRLLSLGLVVVSVVCGGLARRLSADLRLAETRGQDALARVQGQQREIARLRRRVPPPVTPDQLSVEERELLGAASVLIERRVFRWSQLLHDLEANLDNDVRLTRVNVGLEDPRRVDPARPGRAPMEISMVVIGKQLDNVLATMRALHATGRFSLPRLQKQSIVEGTQEVEYEVELSYRPE